MPISSCTYMALTTLATIHVGDEARKKKKRYQMGWTLPVLSSSIACINNNYYVFSIFQGA